LSWYYVALHVDGMAPAAHVVRADRAEQPGPPPGAGSAAGAGQLRLLRGERTVFRAPGAYVLEWTRCDTQRQADDLARAFRERLRDAGRWRVVEGSIAPRVRRRRPGEAPPRPSEAGSVLEGVRVRIEE